MNSGVGARLSYRVLILAVVLVFQGWAPPASGQTTELEQKKAYDAEVEKLVKQLIAEAEQLDVFEKPSPRPVFTRPHRMVRDMSVDLAPTMLKRMTGKLTGNDYRDTYIRWHMIWLVNEMLDDAFASYRQTFLATGDREFSIPPDTSDRIVRLIKAMPGPLQYTFRNTTRWVPPDIAGRYFRLVNQVRVTVGFPPFERTYHGRAALAHVDGATKARFEAILKEAAELRKQISPIVDKELRARNHIARHMNRIVREYRGDLVYAAVKSGDTGTLRLVIDEVGRQVGKDQQIGYDLMAYVYLAAFTGSLSLYDEDTLSDVRRKLDSIARASDEFRRVKIGQKPAPNYLVPKVRNFADYSYHMREILETPELVRQFLLSFETPSRQSVPAKPTTPFDPKRLSLDQIHDAITRATRALNDEHSVHRNILPAYRVRSDYEMWNAHRAGKGVQRQEIYHEAGNQSVVAWALLAGGNSYQDPRLFKRINWVLAADTPYVFDRGMRLMMLKELSYDRWGAYVNRDAKWLRLAITEKGGFTYEYLAKEKDREKWGNHADGQYGVLGLWAAAEAGVDIPESVWKRIDAQWRLTQQKTDGDAPAGWALGMLNVSNAGKVPAEWKRVSAPMTAGGVAVLSLTERYLREDKDGNSKALAKGLAWLDKHFRIDESGPEVDWFYYMWTMQRVGQASGYATFNKIDWFREVTTEMLNRQQPDGLWRDPNNRVGMAASSAFALLFLGNTLDPVGVAKLRYAGDWHDRPNDIWNFISYASDRYEYPTTWQIVEPNQPVYELIEAPLMYLSAGGKVELTDTHIKRIREYIDAGGMLVLNPDKANSTVSQSLRQLVERLYPDRELEKVENDHLFYNIHRQVRPNVQMQAISNGVRPLVVQFTRDIGKGLQENETIKSESFLALSNLYLYSIGLNPRRTRLQTDYLPTSNRPTRWSVSAARIQYEGGYDPEPGALTQLRNLLREKHAVDLKLAVAQPGELSKSTEIAYLTTTGDGGLTDTQAEALRDWVYAGGTLWLDAAGGSKTAVDAAFKMLGQIAPDSVPLPLPSTSPIVTGRKLPGNPYDNRNVGYRLFALHQMGPTSNQRLQAVMINDRPAIIFSPEDLTAGVAGLNQWGIFGYSVGSARKLAVNGVLDTLK